MSRNAEFNAGREPTQAIKVWGSDLGYVPVEHLERLAFQRLRYDPPGVTFARRASSTAYSNWSSGTVS